MQAVLIAIHLIIVSIMISIMIFIFFDINKSGRRHGYTPWGI